MKLRFKSINLWDKLLSEILEKEIIIYQKIKNMYHYIKNLRKNI